MSKTWKVTPHKDAALIRFNEVSDGWQQYVLLTSDRHWDNRSSDWKLQKRHLDLARERNAPIIDIGDWFDAMQTRNDPRADYAALRDIHKRDDYLDALVETAADWFAPWADLFAVVGQGNHETNITKRHHVNLTSHLAARLRERGGKPWPLSGGYGGYIIFRFKIQSTVSRRLVLKYYHGSGGGGPVTKGVIQTNRRGVIYPQADIIATGHIHEAWHVQTVQETISQGGAIGQRVQHHISVPTYKDEWSNGAGGWHVERGAPPKPTGCAWLRFYFAGDSDVGVSVELDTA